MKIKFDPNLDFQKQAIESVARVFEGQEICQTNFTVTPLYNAKEAGLYQSGHTSYRASNNLGIGNR